jgi:uracil-DNA glycosylase family 4
MGRGDINSNILILGEAPGQEEDKAGVPFVGLSGSYLQEKLNNLGVSCFVSNAVRCRPVDSKGNNRTPTPSEIEYCRPFTIDLIQRMKPKVIMTVGRIPMSQLLKLNISMEVIHGKTFYHPELDTTIVPTYHPAYVLRTRDRKYANEFVYDLASIKNLIQISKSRKIESISVSLKDIIDIEAYLNKLCTVDAFSVDIEATGLDPRKDRITDISFCCETGKGVHIEWNRIANNAKCTELLAKALKSNSCKIFHNAAFDVNFLETVNFSINGPIFDTMLAYHTMTMSFEGGQSMALYRLKTMAWMFTQEGGYESVLDSVGGIVGAQKQEEEEKTVKITKKIQGTLYSEQEVADISGIDYELDQHLIKCASYIDDAKKEKLTKFKLTAKEYYSAMDADVTFRLYKYLKLRIDEKFAYPFCEIIMPTCRTLINMHRTGIKLDIPYIDKMIEENNEKLEKIKQEFFKKAKCEFNINSVDQLRDYMYGTLKLPPNNKFITAKGRKPSTDEEAITFYSKRAPILKHILDYRGIAKETSTYLDGFKKLVDENGRIHPSYMQITTASGRLSAVNPNLQNVPRDNRIRNMIIPEKGHKLVISDLSQVELRILAMMADDPAMTHAFMSGHDFHAYTACHMFNIPMDKFDKKDKEHNEKRSFAKTINFGIVYGIRAETIANDLVITLDRAKAFMASFFNTYPKVAQWISGIKAYARQYGYVENIYGRRRYLPFINSSDEYKREGAERQAINTPIQGCHHFDMRVPTTKGYLKIGELAKKEINIYVRNKVRTAIGISSGKKKLYRYYFSDGTSDIVTKEHKYKILKEGMIEEWEEINKLGKNDFIISSCELNKSKYKSIKLFKQYFGSNAKYSFDYSVMLDEELGFLLGVMIGNGSFSKTRGACCCFNHKDKDVADRIINKVNSVFNMNISLRYGQKIGYPSILRINLYHQAITQFFDKCGLKRVTAKYKQIPDLIWESPNSVICSFISGMFTTDGTANKDGASYTTTSKELAYELGNLLHIIGIASGMSRRMDKAFNIFINRDFDKFEKLVGFGSKRKQAMVKKTYYYKKGRRNSNKSDLPFWFSKNIVINSDITHGYNIDALRVIKSRTLRQNKSLYSKTALRFISNVDEYKFLKSGKYLKRIIYREYYGIADAFDLSIIDGNPEFIVNSSLVHNSASDICLIGLNKFNKWQEENNKGYMLAGTVHDSIIVDTPDAYVDEVASMLPYLMTTDMPKVSIKLEADVDILDKWIK